MTSLEEKKNFLNWLSRDVSFPRREIYWILNYLVEHNTILRGLHVVEYPETTPRGLCLSSIQEESDSLTLYIQKQTFTDPLQIFHEIRLNWKEPLYLGLEFENMTSNSFYLGVLEDNPYHKWNDHVEEEIIQKVECYLEKQKYESEKAFLYYSIDLALEKKLEDQFIHLSKQLEQLEKDHLKSKAKDQYNF